MNNREAFREEEEAETIRTIARLLSTATTRGDLGSILACETSRYTLMDLQILGGRMQAELARLPRPYREKIRPFMADQIFGAHHRLLAMHRSGIFPSMKEKITDRENYDRFCAMVPEGCFIWDEHAERMPLRYSPRHRLFYYLISAFTMFVLERPGHPVGMPFPGGAKVEERNGIFYCLIRDHEKEVPFSLCNFCPARQREG